MSKQWLLEKNLFPSTLFEVTPLWQVSLDLQNRLIAVAKLSQPFDLVIRSNLAPSIILEADLDRQILQGVVWLAAIARFDGSALTLCHAAFGGTVSGP